MENSNKTNKSNKRVIIITIAVLFLIGVVFGGVYYFTRPETNTNAKSIIVEVVDNVGKTTTYNHDTNAEFLRQALEEIDGLVIEGDESDFGLFVKSVNGISAVYEVDNAYWSFYTNGEYAMNGIDTEPVNDNDTFSIKYELAS